MLTRCSILLEYHELIFNSCVKPPVDQKEYSLITSFEWINEYSFWSTGKLSHESKSSSCVFSR